MEQCFLLHGASTCTIGFQNSATLFLVLKIGNYSKIFLISDLVCIDHHVLRNFFLLSLSALQLFIIYKENFSSNDCLTKRS